MLRKGIRRGLYSLCFLSICAGFKHPAPAALFWESELPDKSESTLVPFAVLMPDLEEEIERWTEPHARIRKALQLLAGQLSKANITVFSNDGINRRGADELGPLRELVDMGPKSHGELRREGILWQWEVHGTVKQTDIFNRAAPIFARFQIRIDLIVRTTDPTKRIHIVIRPKRWFFIVKGKGKIQNATVAPPNAPACSCGCGDGPTCACGLSKPVEEEK